MRVENLIEPLTKRELEVLSLLAANRTNQEIASDLGLSLNSVKWFARQIYSKLGVDNRREAVLKASQLGLLVTGSVEGQKDTAHKLPSGTVTFLFTDIQGSTPLWEKMPKEMSAAISQHHSLLRQAIELNGGQVFQIIGDAFQAAFRLAPEALNAAISAQRHLQAADWGDTGPIKVRMGIHTGPAELDPLGNAPYQVSHTLNRAARIMSAAHGGQILLSEEAANLVERELPQGAALIDLGRHHLKGMEYPEHLYQLITSGLPAEFPPLKTEHPPIHNLPLELTSFIGRQREIAQVEQLLKEHRLVTLTGSGGVGKTRLSLQVAGRFLAKEPDGVWYVELAPITDPDLVPQTVAAALGLREDSNHSWMETLGRFLSNRALLLVLDNCEHVLAACARLADALLRKASGLRILTSSREALGIAGEYAFRVPSLSAPDLQQELSLLGLQEYESVQLFVARAQAVQPGFVLQYQDAAAVAAICQRLDGIPLALELAAARLTLPTPEQLASRLDRAFRLLTGGSRTALPRQQTLRATIDWSYQLLSIQELVLLRRLAVFAGSGSLEAIEAICSGEEVEVDQILDRLAGLVNKSMVNTEHKQFGEIRYRLLETVRQYVREKLFDSGEVERLRNRHLDYYVTLSEASVPQIHGAGRLEWTCRLKEENDNIREALEWSFQDSTQALQGLRIATAITDHFWLELGINSEAFRWLNNGLRATGDDIPALLKAKFLYCLARVAPPDQYDAAVESCIQFCRKIGPQADRELCLALAVKNESDYEKLLANLVEAVRIARGIGPSGKWALGEVLFFYSMVLSMHPGGAYDDQALVTAQESLDVIQDGDRWNAGANWIIGAIQLLRGEPEQARLSVEKMLQLSKEVDSSNGLLYSLFNLVLLHRLSGQYAMAQSLCQELYQCVHASGKEDAYALYVYSTSMLFVCWLNAYITAENLPNSQIAVRLVSFSSWFLDESNKWPWYDRLKKIDLQALEQLHHRLDDKTFSRAWIEGRALSLERAVSESRTILGNLQF